jgi:hypothetical protein
MQIGIDRLCVNLEKRSVILFRDKNLSVATRLFGV